MANESLALIRAASEDSAGVGFEDLAALEAEIRLDLMVVKSLGPSMAPRDPDAFDPPEPLDQVLAILEDGLEPGEGHRWLMEAQPETDDRRPVDLMTEGAMDAVMLAAREVAAQRRRQR